MALYSKCTLRFKFSREKELVNLFLSSQDIEQNIKINFLGCTACQRTRNPNNIKEKLPAKDFPLCL